MMTKPENHYEIIRKQLNERTNHKRTDGYHERMMRMIGRLMEYTENASDRSWWQQRYCDKSDQKTASEAKKLF